MIIKSTQMTFLKINRFPFKPGDLVITDERSSARSYPGSSLLNKNVDVSYVYFGKQCGVVFATNIECDYLKFCGILLSSGRVVWFAAHDVFPNKLML
jgi:hypothetical protein